MAHAVAMTQNAFGQYNFAATYYVRYIPMQASAFVSTAQLGALSVASRRKRDDQRRVTSIFLDNRNMHLHVEDRKQSEGFSIT
jgi:hypothetical protein